MEFDPEICLRAVSLLLDVENAPRLTGTAIYRVRHGDGAPTVSGFDFMVDHATGEWSTRSHDTGDERSGVHRARGGRVIDLAADASIPPPVDLLFPLYLMIWGRPSDKWKMRGATAVDGGYLLTLADQAGFPSESEIFIDAALALPTRRTTTYGQYSITNEVELTEVVVHGHWPDPPPTPDAEEGTLLAGFVAGDDAGR